MEGNVNESSCVGLWRVPDRRVWRLAREGPVKFYDQSLEQNRLLTCNLAHSKPMPKLHYHTHYRRFRFLDVCMCECVPGHMCVHVCGETRVCVCVCLWNCVIKILFFYTHVSSPGDTHSSSGSSSLSVDRGVFPPRWYSMLYISRHFG